MKNSTLQRIKKTTEYTEYQARLTKAVKAGEIEFLGRLQAAIYLHITEAELRRQVAQGLLNEFLFYNAKFYKLIDLDAWKESNPITRLSNLEENADVFSEDCRKLRLNM